MGAYNENNIKATSRTLRPLLYLLYAFDLADQNIRCLMIICFRIIENTLSAIGILSGIFEVRSRKFDSFEKVSIS